MCCFIQRTVEPFVNTASQGCNKPTSRWQTITSLRSLDYYNSVIPGVPFIWWSNNLSLKIFGSLKPTFVFVWFINLTIWQTFLLLCSKTKFFVWVYLLYALVTFYKAAVPAKLPLKHCLILIISENNFVNNISLVSKNWKLSEFLIDSYFMYSVQQNIFSQCLIIVKVHGVFSSKNELLGSAPTFEFHRIKKYDSLGVIIGIMQDYIY